jgi:hypothetical protein
MNTLIAQWLPLFFDPDDVFEVRGLDVERPGRKVAGFITAKRIPAMAGTIAALAEKAGGVYFTPQRLYSQMLNRSAHHLSEVTRRGDEIQPKPTNDEDVIFRRYLIIDVDPIRPREFKKLSATDAEKSSAADLAANVRSYLGAKGWPAPLVVDSGNGYHLYYRFEHPLSGGNIADSLTDPMAQLLRALKAKFDTPQAGIDPVTFNPSRIMKIPGTPSRKGDATLERPHRTSSVLEVPNGW